MTFSTRLALKGTKTLLLFLSLALVAACSPAILQKPFRGPFNLQTGDMIFLDLDCGDICTSIERVTLEQFDQSSPRLSHVGVLEVVNDDTFVWEAWPTKGVTITPLRDFLERVKGQENQDGGYYIGRLRPAFRSIGIAAVEKMKTVYGASYDDAFDWNDNRYYCSELVAFGFSVAQPLQESLFRPKAMYFGRRGSSDWLVWRKYFNDLGVEMPEKSPGISPLGIYLEGKRRLFISND